jgi:hypothetical protein
MDGSQQYITKMARPGRNGKVGKKGKNGKNINRRATKKGEIGKNGSISFVILNEQGFKESGGTPFRIAFDQEDILKLVPIPIHFTIPQTTKPTLKSLNTTVNNHFQVLNTSFLYGEQLQFGPILPINMGSLTAPPSLCICQLIIPEIVTLTQTLPFPEIPPEDKTRYGKLLPTSKQTLTLTLPFLQDLIRSGKPSSYGTNTTNHLPSSPTATAIWTKDINVMNNIFEEYYQMIKRTAFLTLEFCIDGLMQRTMQEENNGGKSKLTYELLLDVPLTLIPTASYNPSHVPSNNSTTASSITNLLLNNSNDNVIPPILKTSDTVLIVPKSMIISPETTIPIHFRIMNTMIEHDIPIKTNTEETMYYAKLVILSQYFRPKLLSPSLNIEIRNIELPATSVSKDFDQSKGFLATEYLIHLNGMKAQELKCIDWKLSLNIDTSGKSNEVGEIVYPGAYLYYRIELFVKNICVMISPIQETRLCGSWPPPSLPRSNPSMNNAGSRSSSSNIMVFVSCAAYQISDYLFLSKFATTIGMIAYFLDYQHFADHQSTTSTTLANTTTTTNNNNNNQNTSASTLHRILPSNIWQSYLGRNVFVMILHDHIHCPNYFIHRNDLFYHLQQGGNLIVHPGFYFWSPNSNSHTMMMSKPLVTTTFPAFQQMQIPAIPQAPAMYQQSTTTQQQHRLSMSTSNNNDYAAGLNNFNIPRMTISQLLSNDLEFAGYSHLCVNLPSHPLNPLATNIIPSNLFNSNMESHINTNVEIFPVMIPFVLCTLQSFTFEQLLIYLLPSLHSHLLLQPQQSIAIESIITTAISLYDGYRYQVINLPVFVSEFQPKGCCGGSGNSALGKVKIVPANPSSMTFFDAILVFARNLLAKDVEHVKYMKTDQHANSIQLWIYYVDTYLLKTLFTPHHSPPNTQALQSIQQITCFAAIFYAIFTAGGMADWQLDKNEEKQFPLLAAAYLKYKFLLQKCLVMATSHIPMIIDPVALAQRIHVNVVNISNGLVRVQM